ncbi:NAD(P)/FAD-dependent oxidoreductase [Pseudomonas frederiksbergensis]|nr:NAD(P)/FAD-dependent oxidoreductase [Pseudomonas frederiksbergensis]
MKVVVIGTGPAGCSAAITLRRYGIEVSLVEPSERGLSPPGETLHPGIEPLLARLGVLEHVLDAGYLRHEGHWLTWNGARQYVPFGSDENGPWRGFQAPRSDFDARLRTVAVREGTVLISRRLRQVVMDQNGRLCGVLTDQGLLPADWVVDCSGQARWVARQLGIEYQIHSPRLLARYGYASGLLQEALPSLESDQYGWTWIAEIATQRFQWTRLTSLAQRNPKNWTPSLLDRLCHEPSRGADMTWRIAKLTAGRGWLLAGDAAAVLDPSSSHGVLRALMTGMMAANAIANGTITGYSEWLSDWFHHDMLQLRAAYREANLFWK